MRSHHEKGNQYFSEQNFQKALTCYQAEVKANPKNEKSWKNQATCYRRLNDNYAAFFAAVEAFNIKPDYEAALFEIGSTLKNFSTPESAGYIACIAQFYWDSFITGVKPINSQTKELFKNLLANYTHVDHHDPLIQGLLGLAVMQAEKKEAVYARFLQLIRNHTKEEHSAIEHRFDYTLLQNIREVCMNYHLESAYKEIFPLMTMGELIGMPDICVMLADYYVQGLGCEIDFNRAVTLYDKAVKLEVPAAYMRAACFYLEETNPFKDEIKAFNYFLLAAEKNEAAAYFPLGSMYLDGSGTERNLEKAFKYFEMAVNNDSDLQNQENKAQAQHSLALCYYEGFSVPKDYVKARKLLLQAAPFVDGSWYLLALISIKSNNTQLAKLYLDKGVEKGCPHAKNLQHLILKISVAKFVDFLSLFASPLPKAKIRTAKKTKPPELPSLPAKSEVQELVEKLPPIAPNKLSQPQQKRPKRQQKQIQSSNVNAVEVKKVIPQIETDEAPISTVDRETDELFSKAQSYCFDLVKNKNAKEFQEVFDTLIHYAHNSKTTVIQFRVYDFFLQTLTEIMSKELKETKLKIAKRVLNIDWADPKNLRQILDSLKFIEALKLVYQDKESQLKSLFKKNIHKKLQGEESNEIKDGFDHIDALYHQVLLNLTKTKLDFMEMDRKIKEHKNEKLIQRGIEEAGANAANLSREKLLEIGINAAMKNKKKKPGPFKLEKNILSEGVSLLEAMDELDISPKVILKKIPLMDEEVRICSFLKLNTNYIILGGSTVLKKLLEDPSFGCEIKINTEMMGKDYDFYSIDPQKEKLICASIHPAIDVKNLYSFQGTEHQRFSKSLQLYFFENTANNNYSTLVKSLKGVCTIDNIAQDEYGNIIGTPQAFDDLRQGKLSLIDKNPEQFNQDSVRILHLIKKVTLGFQPDQTVESALENWVKTGKISNLDHFKAVIRREFSTEDKLYTQSFLNILHKYGVIGKLFKDEKNVWTVAQLKELLKPRLVAQENRLFQPVVIGKGSLTSPDEKTKFDFQA